MVANVAMRALRWLTLAFTLCLSLEARAAEHVVQDGQTLGGIARRYNVTIPALCEANSIRRRDPIKPGQRLVIPSKDEGESPGPAPAEAKEVEASAPEEASEKRKSSDITDLPGGMHAIDLPGLPPAYFFEPSGPGRKSMKPVIVYLHGRGGHPDKDCRRWAPVARRLGWLICPSGPSPYGDGRAWDNNWPTAQRATMSAIRALREEYGRRVQLWGNTLIGFSEGAYAAMNVGVREPRTFNRWLILAANSSYWGGPGLDALGSARDRVRRVYLITGERDGVVDGTREVENWLRRAGVTTRVSTPNDMGHEVVLERKPELYRAALAWLDNG
jgi:predicted esterase/LysM repeat protein